MKRCSKCLEEKPVSEFCKARNGFGPWCKPCHASHARNYRQTQSAKDAITRYRQKPKWHFAHASMNKTYNRRYPDKRAARRALDKAVSRGKIIKPTNCESCNKQAKIIEGHHFLGYAWENRYTVQWLCNACHRSAHAITQLPVLA